MNCSDKKHSAQISSKVLGGLANPDCCKRCFWLKIKMRQQFPYAIFPGIFSSIDAFTKRAIHGVMDKFSKAPPYLQDIGEIKRYIEPPHHTKFTYLDPYTSILLTGEADGIFELKDRTIAIVDYKTARFTNNQDEMLQTYCAQLNSYALIAEHLGLGFVSNLALIYMEPLTDCDDGMSQFCSLEGLQLHFYPKIIPVKRDSAMIPHLLQLASSILNNTVPPSPNKDCKNCSKTNEFITLITLS